MWIGRVWIAPGAIVPPAIGKRSAPRPTMPRQAMPFRRRRDDAEDRHAVRHDRDVDGEFVAAGDEFLGPVERVDQKIAAARAGLRSLMGRLLLRNDRNRRRQSLQAVADRRLPMPHPRR